MRTTRSESKDIGSNCLGRSGRGASEDPRPDVVARVLALPSITLNAVGKGCGGFQAWSAVCDVRCVWEDPNL